MPAIIAALLSAITGFGVKLFISVFSEKYVAKGFFYVAEHLAAKSTNGIDDDLVKELKDAYYQGQTNNE